MGLPNLASVSPGNVARVATANRLFVLSAEICTYFCHRRIPWTFENPRRSLSWWVPEVQAFLGPQDVELGPRACSAGRKYVGDIFFQHCMHGGARDKWTRLRCYPATIFQSLAVSCNNDHVRKQWGAGPGRFYTADEAGFPPLLCSRIASIVQCHTQHSTQPSPAEPVISHPVQAHSPLPATTTTTSTVHTASDITPAQFSAHPTSAVQHMSTPSSRVTASRIAAGVQPGGNAGPNLITDFKSTTLVRVDAAEVATARDRVGSKLSSWAATVFHKDKRALPLKSAVGVSRREEQHFLDRHSVVPTGISATISSSRSPLCSDCSG